MAKKTANKAPEPVEEAPRPVEATEEEKAVEPTPVEAPKDEKSSEASTSPAPKNASAGSSGTDAPASEPSKAAEMLAEADEDDERTAAIRQAAKDGWLLFLEEYPVEESHITGADVEFSDLTPLEQFGLLSHVQSIVNNPHQDTFAGTMPHGHYHRAYKALDNALRRALGFAEVSHP